MDYDEIYKQAYEDTLEKIAEKDNFSTSGALIGGSSGVGATALYSRNNPQLAKKMLNIKDYKYGASDFASDLAKGTTGGALAGAFAGVATKVRPGRAFRNFVAKKGRNFFKK